MSGLKKTERSSFFHGRANRHRHRQQVKCCTRHAQLQHMPRARKVLLSRYTSSCVRLATFYAHARLSHRCRSESADPDGEWPRRTGDLPTQLVRRIFSVPLVSNLSQTSALKNTALIRDKQLILAERSGQRATTDRHGASVHENCLFCTVVTAVECVVVGGGRVRPLTRISEVAGRLSKERKFANKPVGPT